jgi:hypothetical protein
VEERIKQHRAVPVGQHDAVAVGPVRVGRVVLQVPRVQRRGDLGHAERHAGVPLAGAHDRVDGEEADRVRERLQGVRCGRHGSGPRVVTPLSDASGALRLQLRSAAAGGTPFIAAMKSASIGT